jgi:hypothetical protein
MRASGKVFLALIVLVGSAALLLGSRTADKPVVQAIAERAPRVDPSYGRLPLSFIENGGQIVGPVDYYLPGRNQSLYFGGDGLTVVLYKIDTRRSEGFSGSRIDRSPGSLVKNNGKAGRWVVKLRFLGANPGVKPAGEKPTSTEISYFKGRPEEWRTGIRSFSRLAYRDIWPGIDLIYSGTAERLKYEFVVQPGADPSRIRLAWSGASRVSLNAEGELEVGTPLGGFRDEVPLAYQETDGRKTLVPVSFRLEDDADTCAEKAEAIEANSPASSRGFGFAVGEYDRSLPLVLDPATVIYCGFIGGQADDRGNSIAIDGSGNAYVAGWTGSYDFPVTVGPDLSFNSGMGGTDAFVAKVNASGTALVYCGFIGGSWDDVASGVAVDGSGNAYVTGWTFSQDFPAFVGPGLSYLGNITQFGDAFVAKVAASGTALSYSGFVGGSLADRAAGIAVDGSGNAYISGYTESSDFPAVTGPDVSYNGAQDAFVAKVAASGTGLAYAGFIGGSASDYGTGIALDGSGSAYVTGYTNSYPAEHFPVTVGPVLTFKGGLDAFVAKLNAAGTGLVYCGYIGGTADDYGSGIAVDPSGNAYVTGATDSQFQFPVKGGPYLVHHDGDDAFIAKVAASGAEFVYCGFIGGSGEDLGQAVAVDGAGLAYVAGSTDSASDFPVKEGPYLVQAGLLDAFIATVSSSGEDLIYCGFLGGSQDDEAAGIAADGVGNVYVAGYTRSNNFPVTVGPILVPGAGLVGISDDAFVARISEELPPLPPDNLRAGTVTSTEINLLWDDHSTNEVGFKVERKTGAAGSWSQIATTGAGVTTYQNNGLTEGTTYYYRVRAYNNIGDSAYSNEAPIETRPAAPTGLTATAVNERRVDLSWTDHSSSETGFRVERKVNAGDPWTAIATLGANVVAYSDTHVVETTTYTYHVLAFNDGGDSAPSNEASATTPALTVPAPPTGLGASALSASAVLLTWTDASYNEDLFKIERKTGAGGAWAQIATAAAEATSYQDGTVAESTSYVYRVRASNGAGDSEYSNEAPVTTPVNQPLLRVPVAGIDFGSVNVCTSSDGTTVLYNDGGAALAVTAISLTSGSTRFAYTGPALPFSVPPLGSQAITVRFSPLVTGPAAAAFAVASNDAAHPTAGFDVAGTGFVPTITLSLQAQRQVERAWIIRREYGRITLTVTKSAPFNVTTYRLSRKAGAGSYQTVKDFGEGDFQSGHLTYIDLFLQTGTSYTYKVEALDCSGTVLASSAEAGAVSPAPPPVIRRAARTVKK